jgi:ATP-dependent exoDNAse (exonuclease V) beta subunit
MLQPQGEQVAANLLKVSDQARTFAEADGGGLRGFVRWMKDNMERQSDETDAVISEDTDDVVRILTIHASKGLEFPVVVFANMNTTRSDRIRIIGDRATRRLHIRLGAKEKGFATPGWDDVHELETEHATAEEVRLLYVAATRARDHLVLPFFERNSGGAPDAKRTLNEILRKGGADKISNEVRSSTLPAVDGDVPVLRPGIDSAADPAEVERIGEERTQWAAAHGELVARAARPLLVQTATALKPEWEHPHSGTEDGVRRGRAADFGSAVHAAIERTGLRTDADIDAIAREVAKEFGMAARVDEIAAVTRKALAMDVVARARASSFMLLEAPFVAGLPSANGNGAVPEGLAEGRIDLLFEEDGGLVIVDFKTDSVSSAEIDARVDHYRNQALVYAWAAHRATGMVVREVVFAFARPGIEHATRVDDAFMGEAAGLIAAG